MPIQNGIVNPSKYIMKFLLLISLLLLTACDNKPAIDLPAADRLNRLYPISIHEYAKNGGEYLIISRYADKPILIYLPKTEELPGVVVFQHGRPFKMPTDIVSQLT